MNNTVVGIDLAKRSFQIHQMDSNGRKLLSKKVSREKLREVVANIPATLVAMEACSGAHCWAREFQKVGHEVRLIAPQFVKPYVKTHKNDAADAEVIAEAATREHMRFVPVEEIWQQDLLALRRIRERLVHNRTQLGNQIRGLLHEYGVVFPQGIAQLKGLLSALLIHERERVSVILADELDSLNSELLNLEERVECYDKKIARVAKESEPCKRLMEMPGIGPITATAVVATIGNAANFHNGRELAAWFGLVPRQESTGGRTRLLGISKRGDRYIRCLLVHGARSWLRSAAKRSDRVSRWAERLHKEKGHNKAAVALANKMARMMYPVLARHEAFAPKKAA